MYVTVKDALPGSVRASIAHFLSPILSKSDCSTVGNQWLDFHINGIVYELYTLLMGFSPTAPKKQPHDQSVTGHAER